jgi:hypothetical protein
MAASAIPRSTPDFGLDDLLMDVCEELQITATQYARAESAYSAVGRWLGDVSSPLHEMGVRIYPQGSLALRTTTRPRGKEEYDLDTVCEVEHAPLEPQQLYDLVLARLRQHAEYSKRIEEKKRCIRLAYSGDFHLDVLPSRPENNGSPNAILIPDRQMDEWRSTNPLEFIKWFERNVRRQRSLLAKATQSPLPTPLETKGAGPLRNAVQLLKRYRDNVFYTSTIDVAPRSIVLTTLAGQLYAGSDSLIETLGGLTAQMSTRKRFADVTGSRLVVLNPVAQSEDFSERWEDAECYRAFDDYLNALSSDLVRLQSARGLTNISKILDEMFGDDVGARSVNRYSNRVQEARDRKTLGSTVAGGLATAASRPAQPHTFHHG